MQFITSDDDLQYCGPQAAPRYIDKIGNRDTTLNEHDVGTGGHSRPVLRSQSTQALVVVSEAGTSDCFRHIESSISSGTAAEKTCSISSPETTSIPQQRPDPQILLVNDVDTSDLSELSDTCVQSVLEEDEGIFMVPDASNDKTSQIRQHKVHAERPTNFSPRHQHLKSIKPLCKQDKFVSPISPSTEDFAVKNLLQNARSHVDKLDRQSPEFLSLDGDEFTEFELSQFSIYLPQNKFQSFSMRGLQHLGTRSNNTRYLFDGILSVGAIRHYVQDIPFTVRSIGNYGEDLHEVGSHIWIESELNTDSNIFYRLGEPSAEYARFHDEFLWLADFAKHFVDYIQTSQQPISLHRFRTDFFQWLSEKHSKSSAFRAWYKKYNKVDFRSPVSVNIAFLFSESIGVDPELRSHPIWSEVMSRDIVPLQKTEEGATLVTEYIYKCFKDMRFGHHLKIPSLETTQKAQGSPGTEPIRFTSEVFQKPLQENDCSSEFPKRSQSDATLSALSGLASVSFARTSLIKGVKVGDVLSVVKDGSQSVWKDEVSRWKEADDCWYVYVQKIHRTRYGKATYDAIWLYRPSDTSCAKMKYPYPEELFMSDNCTCLKTRIAEDEVLGITTVRWYGTPSDSNPGHFIRQTYLQNESFVTFRDEHRTCEHLRSKSNKAEDEQRLRYPIGSTVLVPPPYRSKYELEPFEIDSYVDEASKQIAVLRRLIRRQEVDKCGEENELVYTDGFEKVPTHEIQRSCLVRFYNESDIINHTISVPYDRKGNGNSFYITTRLIEKHGKKSLKPIGSAIPQSLIQGFNPLDLPSRNLLNGLDLFCGGGNFGRGLEEGGAVRNKWAVDIDRNAIHTYNANVDESAPTKLFYGSVNDMLNQAIRGNPRKSELIPLPGDVDFISAGSPCQGFSHLNKDPNNEKGLRNQSLIASVAAYIDFYRPKYGILENVLSMAKRGHGRDEDVMSQLICAIVGMGYQVQLNFLDAWSFGSPQSRARLFLILTAPGLTPMEHPELSHSHPPNAWSRGLGKLANGQAFGVRRSGPTPFERVTLEQVMSDLPSLGDGATYQCIPFPDHVMVGTLTEQLRGRIEAIPTQPRAMNLYKAWNNGNGPMTYEELERFPPLYKNDGTMRAMYKPQSRAYTRVDPKGMYPCMTGAVSPGDIRMGSGIHWDDQRMFTAMEGRRIQGVPECEVFLGSPTEVWKILGNSVNRNVALALGLSLRDAWLANDTALCQAPVGSEAAILKLDKSCAINLASKPRTTTKSKTPRRSTGRVVSVKNPMPLPHQVVDCSDDESGLAEWTCNLMSLNFATSIGSDPAPKFSANTIPAPSNEDILKRATKRPHSSIQETSIASNEKSKKSPRSVKISAGGQITLSESDVHSTTVTCEVSKKRSSRDITAPRTLQQIARESLQQTDSGYDLDRKSQEAADSDIEVLFSSVVTRFPSHHSQKSRRRKKELPSRPKRRRPPTFVNLVSDDDEEVVYQSRQKLQAPSCLQQQWTGSHVPKTASPQVTQPQDHYIQGSTQHNHLPSTRPSHPLAGYSAVSNDQPNTQRLNVQPQNDVYSPNVNRIPRPSGPTELPAPVPGPSVDNVQSKAHDHHKLNGATHEHTIINTTDVAEKEIEEVGMLHPEMRPIEAASAVPAPRYLPVDNGGFMAYFQTSRYLGQKPGRY